MRSSLGYLKKRIHPCFTRGWRPWLESEDDPNRRFAWVKERKILVINAHASAMVRGDVPAGDFNESVAGDNAVIERGTADVAETDRERQGVVFPGEIRDTVSDEADFIKR
jgi:hypothetical protein